MPEFWVPQAPWWEYVLRAVLVYVAFLVLIRLCGKRTVGEFTPFDLILVILIGESAQSGLTGGDESMGSTLIVAATLIALNYAVRWLSARSAWFDRLVEGSPVVLARNGRMLKGALRRNQISQGDFEEAMRQQKCPGVEHIRLAVLETDGEINIELLDAEDATAPRPVRTAEPGD